MVGHAVIQDLNDVRTANLCGRFCFQREPLSHSRLDAQNVGNELHGDLGSEPEVVRLPNAAHSTAREHSAKAQIRPNDCARLEGHDPAQYHGLKSPAKDGA